MEYSATLKKLVKSATNGVPLVALIIGKPLNDVADVVHAPLAAADDTAYYAFVKKAVLKSFNVGLVKVEFHDPTNLSRFLDIRPHLGMRFFIVEMTTQDDILPPGVSSSLTVISSGVENRLSEDDFNILVAAFDELDVVQGRAEPSSELGDELDAAIESATAFEAQREAQKEEEKKDLEVLGM